MRHVLILSAFLLLSSNAAAGTDFISVFTDESASNCQLATGFTQTATVMHKFTVGASSSRFRLEFPAGSSFLEFVTTFPLSGSIVSDGTLQYGECMAGSIVLGTITAILAQGELWVRPAEGYTDVLIADCDSVEMTALCGSALVGIDYPYPYCPTCLTVAVEATTWGAVKSLYR